MKLGAQLRDYERGLRTTVRQCLIVVGFIGVSRGVVYLPLVSDSHKPGDIPFGVEFVSQFIPLWFWAALWMVSGLVSFYCAVIVEARGTAGVVGVSLVWSFGYLASFGFALAGSDLGSIRDILGFVIYLALAMLLIRGRTLAESCLELVSLVRSLVEVQDGPGDGAA